MNLVFSKEAWDDYLYWQETDKKMLRRIHELIKDATRHPYAGLGKPEPLRHALAGYWSRRITDEHRMVYKVEGVNLWLAQLRYHYE
jgi:toxin YoeB